MERSVIWGRRSRYITAVRHFASRLQATRSPLQLHGVRQAPASAAGAAHRDQEVLLLLLIEVRALDEVTGLLCEQIVQRHAAGRAAPCIGLGQWYRIGCITLIRSAGRDLTLR